MDETTPHLLTSCNYTEAVWNLPNFSLMSAQGGLAEWLQHLLNQGSASDKKAKTGLLFTFWWLILKERNNQIFEQWENSAQQAAALFLDSIRLQNLTWDSAD
jgi:hypothetical protein